MAIDEVGQIKIQLTDGYVYVVRVNTKAGMETLVRFLKSLSIRTF